MSKSGNSIVEDDRGFSNCSKGLKEMGELIDTGEFLLKMINEGRRALSEENEEIKSTMLETVLNLEDSSICNECCKESVPVKSEEWECVHNWKSKSDFIRDQGITKICNEQCPEIVKKKGIIQKMKFVIKDRLKEVQYLNAELMKKKYIGIKELEDKHEGITADILESVTVIDTNKIPLAYEILRREITDKKNMKKQEKEHMLKIMLKSDPPKHYLTCTEDTLKKTIGTHRILPKDIRIDFVLERAFRKRNTTEEGRLYNMFVETMKLSDDLFNNQTEEIRSSEMEDTPIEEKSDEYVCECSLVRKQIKILEYVKEIIEHVYSEEDDSSSDGQTILESIFSDISIDKSAHKVASRVIGSPSFERLRENILHELRIERRPLSWFKRRCEYFGKNNKRKQLNDDERAVKRSQQMEDKSKQRKIQIVTQEAVNEILELHKSKPYSTLENPDDYVFAKLSKIQRKLKNAVSQETQLHKTERETMAYPPDSELINLRKGSLYKKLEETRHFAEIVDKEFTSKTKLDVVKIEEETIQNAENTPYNEEEIQKAMKRANAWEEVKKLLKRIETTEHKKRLTSKELDMREILKVLNIRKKVALLKEPLLKDDTSDEENRKRYRKSQPCLCPGLNKKKKYLEDLKGEVEEIIVGNKTTAVSSEEVETSLKESIDLMPNMELQIPKEISLQDENDEHRQSIKSVEDSTQIWENSILNGLFEFNNDIQLMMNERVIICPQKKKRVKVMSGGRVGLEPLYSEYVAEGMLDCVVLGNKYNAPMVKTILQALLDIAAEEGIIVIIMNEHEYRLNFSLAINKAKELGVKAELILARDNTSDIPLDERQIGRPGSVGIVALFKVAAAMAERGCTLESISRICQFMFIASASCHIINQQIYVGTTFENISGRPVEETSLLDVTEELLQMLIDPEQENCIAPEPDTEVILLVNNQGLTYDEVYTVVRVVSDRLLEINVKLERVYTGNFIALPGDGFTLTIIKDWKKDISMLLDDPTTCSHWPPHTSSGSFHVSSVLKAVSEKPLGVYISSDYLPIMNTIIERVLSEMRAYIRSCNKEQIELANQLNGIMEKLRTDFVFKKLPLDRPFRLLTILAEQMEQLSCIGRKLSLFLISSAMEFMKDENYPINWRMVCNAIYRGAYSLAGYSKHREGDGTISDFLLPLGKAAFSIKPGWNPMWQLEYQINQLQNNDLLNKNDVGIKFCLMIITSLLEVFKSFYGHLDWTAWKEEKEKLIVAVSTDPEKQVYNFCTEKISRDLKERIKELEMPHQMYEEEMVQDL